MSDPLRQFATPGQLRYLDAIEKHGGLDPAAKALGINRRTIQRGLNRLRDKAGLTDPALDLEAVRLREENVSLRSRVKDLERQSLHDSELATAFQKLAETPAKPPQWVFEPGKRSNIHGAPTLFLSDFHWGEVVNGPEVNNVNTFNLATAHRRLRRVVESALHLLFDVYAQPDYPGIVVPLGGDMLSGNIHEELRDTNETRILPAVLDLVDHLEGSFRLLLEHFDHIFAPAVVGNHGRLDRQKRMKGGVEDNVDWLVAKILQQRFEGEERVRVVPSDSFDYYYRIYSHRYLLTHGDAMRGGAGIAGPATPWALGTHKRRQRQAAVDQPFDTMIFGHFHTLAWGIGSAYICNGSLKGYDEYAFKSSFPYEPAQQALWLTHPRYGITSLWGVRADKPAQIAAPWVSLQKVAA